MQYYEVRPGEKLAYQLLNPNASLPGILMISGWTAVIEDWHKLEHFLAADGRPILVFDNRGLGRSVITEGSYSVELLANDAYQLAQNVLLPVSTDGYHIFGISMGGMIAQTILANPARDTSKILSVILGCTSRRISECITTTNSTSTKYSKI
jgi:pimeloyl-ACP methyl ester carboxylesterase